MLSQIKHSVSTLYGRLEPVGSLDMVGIIDKIIEHVTRMYSPYVSWQVGVVHRIHSQYGSYTIDNSPLEPLVTGKKPFPSQITFVLATSVVGKFFKMKVTVSSQIHVPGVITNLQQDLKPCLNSIVVCLEEAVGHKFTVEGLEPHMLNYKFDFSGKKIDFYQLNNCLLEFEEGKVRLDTEHLKYFIKTGDFDQDSLLLVVDRMDIPKRLHVNFESLIAAIRAVSADTFPQKIDVVTRNMPNNLAWYFNKAMFNYIVRRVLEELEKDFRNHLILFAKNVCTNTCMTLTFRPKELLSTGKEITVQLYPTGKINVNNGTDYVVTSRVRDWLVNFFSIYGDRILYD